MFSLTELREGMERGNARRGTEHRPNFRLVGEYLYHLLTLLGRHIIFVISSSSLSVLQSGENGLDGRTTS